MCVLEDSAAESQRDHSPAWQVGLKNFPNASEFLAAVGDLAPKADFYPLQYFWYGWYEMAT